MEISAPAVKAVFNKLFPNEPLIIRSPGRINLIGEHVDYNDGFVMPAAIDKEIFFAIASSADNTTTIHSTDYNESFAVDLSNPVRVDQPSWANYLLGVIKKFQEEGHPVKPFNCVFGGNIPAGAGMSSSAALECGFGFGLAQLNDISLSRQEIGLMAQWAEHHYAGVKCGIMDQFASILSQADHVMMLDCRSLEVAYFPLELSDCAIVLCNTNVKHALVDSEYNTRRLECEEGVKVLAAKNPRIKSLRDATLAEVDDVRAEMKGKVYERCSFIVSEIERVQRAAEDLKKGDLIAFGKKMYEAHDGLSRQYEVSCKELDFLVDVAREHNVIGSRMMGGGFGGCTINIVKEDQIDRFISTAQVLYKNKFGKDMTPYTVKVKSGTSLL